MNAKEVDKISVTGLDPLLGRGSNSLFYIVITFCDCGLKKQFNKRCFL